MSFDKELFKGKSLSDVFKEIHSNSKNKDTQISGLVEQLTNLIESPGDATLIVPLIKDYLDVSIKNNEHLIKLASIVQRLETAKSGDGNDALYDFDQLQELVEESREEVEDKQLPEHTEEDEEKNDNED